MKNTNPIYLQEFVGSAALALIGAGGMIGGGIKAARIEYNCRKVLKAFPTPQDLINYLWRLKNPKANQYIELLRSISNPNDYKLFIKKYICGNTVGSWLSTLFLPWSAYAQGVKGFYDTSNTAQDTVNDNFN